MRQVATALLSVGLLAAGCESAKAPSPQSLLTVDVGPKPIQAPLACPAPPPSTLPCILSLTPTVTIAEAGGLGARLEAIDVTIVNLATSDRFQHTITGETVKAQAGTDRIEAGKTLSFQLQIAYPVACCSAPRLSATFSFRFRDDKGNALTQDIQLAIG
ncbi:MAG TPA: hypothetical protein VJU18_08875 [Vicinamibacteria bacterium]|nr:hypothetical protein [Vicinamibacteria bacterium]